MLVRIFPEQLAKQWALFAPMIAQSLPPQIGVSSIALVNFLTAVLMEDIEIYLYKDEDNDMWTAMVAVQIVEDRIICTKQFLIYCLYQISPMEIKKWKIGFKSLQDLAKRKGCSEIIGYARRDDDRYVRFLKQLGMEDNTLLVRLTL